MIVVVVAMQENCADFESSRWFTLLLQHGDCSGSSGNKEEDDDLDLKLIPSIVEKVLLAKLTGNT